MWQPGWKGVWGRMDICIYVCVGVYVCLSKSTEICEALSLIEGGRRRGRQRMRWLDGITDSMDMSLSNSGSWWWTGRPGMLQSMGSQRVGHNWATEQNWTENFFFLTEIFICQPGKGVKSYAIGRLIWCVFKLTGDPENLLKLLKTQYHLNGLPWWLRR